MKSKKHIWKVVQEPEFEEIGRMWQVEFFKGKESAGFALACRIEGDANELANMLNLWNVEPVEP
jgi:hypothetical protein